MERQQQQQYTLPGIMHYLQSEWSRNERDRIQWAIEREEMKSTIARLNSENASLKAINKQLRQKLENSTNFTVEQKTFGEIDINPLAEARQHLKNRMNEVLYILKTTDSNPDPLGLADDLGFFAKENNKSNNNHVNSQHLPALPNPQELQQKLRNVSLKDSVRQQQPSPKQPEILSSRQKLALSSHMSQINTLSLRSDQLLSSSLDGTVKLWILEDLENADTKPLKTYKDVNAKFLKWADEEWFITANETTVKLWNKNDDAEDAEDLKTEIKDIKDIDVSENWVVIATDSVEIYTLDTKTVSITKEHTVSIQTRSVSIDGEKAYVYTDSLQEIDLKTGNWQTVETHGLNITEPVIKLQTFNGQISFITESELYIYDINKSSIVFKLAQPDISTVELLPSKTIVFYKSGTVEVYTSSTLVRQFNHFEPIFGGVKYSDLKDEEKDMFGNADNVGILLNEHFVITGGEDSTIRVFEI